MLLKNIILLTLCSCLSHGVVHDYYTGEPVSESQMKFYETYNLTGTCTIEIKPCVEGEWRRTDGTCNNPQYPASGAFFTPYFRFLPAHYHNGYFQRKAKSGEELPLARVVRVALLGEGKSSHPLFNHNVPAYGVFMFNDIGWAHDTENMLLKTTYCCQNEHMNDYECTPNIIRDDDPVHRFSNIRCMNSTRPLTYQTYKCTTDKIPAPIKKATTSYDLSQIYNSKNKGDKVLRTFQNGELKMEEEDGKLFPPNGPTAICPNNAKPNTRCFENFSNTLLPISLFIIWFVRQHNFIAQQLAQVNPCWDDDMLFEVARDINIAISQQIYYYEWYPALQGRENLIKEGLIPKHKGHRDLYDDKMYPNVALEFSYVFRWFHLLQESTAKLYDKEGNFIQNYPLFNLTFNTGKIVKDIEYLTQSTIRGGCHHNDGTIDPYVANDGLPGVQRSIDLTAGDLNKGRNLGLAPYIDYVRHFLGLNITKFEDLAPLMSKQAIEKLQDVFIDVEDIDVLAGLWVGDLMEGGHIPLLLAKIFNDNMIRALKSDKHSYERADRPHAFTIAQLMQIRKTSLARLMCDVADGVTEVPRNAFFKISKKNPLVNCSQIPKINYNAWIDLKCYNCQAK